MQNGGRPEGSGERNLEAGHSVFQRTIELSGCRAQTEAGFTGDGADDTCEVHACKTRNLQLNAEPASCQSTATGARRASRTREDSTRTEYGDS